MSESLSFGRVRRFTEELAKRIVKNRIIAKKEFINADGKEIPFENEKYIGRKDGHFNIKGTFELEEQIDHPENHILEVTSRYYDDDNTKNPQLKLFINDDLVQSFDINHRYCPIESAWISKDGLFDFRLELYSGNEERKFPINISIIEIDRPTFNAYFDFKNTLECWKTQLDDSDTSNIYEKYSLEAMNKVDFLNIYSSEYYQGLVSANKILNNLVTNDPNVPSVYAIGHTHIDMAWLWTLSQTIEKGERSFSSVLNLMKNYPNFSFLHTSPQLYQFIKERNPKLYRKIKDAVANKRWEPEGAMWIEADCNLTSGESLVRQLLYGKKFFKKEFNVESKILWLPDVFGYSAALPQILKKSNIPYFMSTKLSWNDTNGIPYDSFLWQGIDGSQVLTHLINTVSEGYNPTPWFTTYNGLLNPNVVKKSWESYKEKKLSNEILIAYGYGDGGGGPTFQMLETIKRLEKGYLGMPKVIPAFATEFFEKLRSDSKQKDFPVWMGELYFENHRGTYTSIGFAKKDNRKIENRLQSIEKIYSLYDMDNYPQKELQEIWERTLLNQFHDILPGSSFGPVYDQLKKDNRHTFNSLDQLISNFESDVLEYRKDSLVVFNQLGFERDSIISVSLEDGYDVFDENDNRLETQNSYNHKKLIKVSTNSLSFSNYNIRKVNQIKASVNSKKFGKKYENPDFRILFDESYNIISLFDKVAAREVIPRGKKFNQFVVYEDLPAAYDAWNIDRNYEDKFWLVNKVLSAEIIEQGSIRDTIKIKRAFNDSIITQLVHFYHGTRQITYETHVDWHEHHCLLRVLFPANINSTEATYDIQFGNIKRSVTENTSWQQAQFEVSGQKWMDLSENNYGISLLTDSKYGYNAKYKQIGLSLIKSATEPDKNADQGVHDFIYATVLHDSDWQNSQIMNRSLDLNNPCLVWNQAELKESIDNKLRIDSNNVLIDTVKRAEDDNSLIVRMYEFENKTTMVKLTSNLPFKKVINCDLMENDLDELDSLDNKVELLFSPYEIKTIRIVLN